jgi:hypothetical protein
MILEYGNMWDAWDEADLFLITTNACVKPNACLVMGAGIAKQARDRWPALDFSLGRALLDKAIHETKFVRLGRNYTLLEPEYSLLVSSNWPKRKLGLLQVKRHFHMDASIGIIQRSTDALIAWCAERPEAEVHLNFPGIGHGGLSHDAVMPIIERLPHNVRIWQFKQEEQCRA